MGDKPVSTGPGLCDPTAMPFLKDEAGVMESRSVVAVGAGGWSAERGNSRWVLGSGADLYPDCRGGYTNPHICYNS